MSVTLDFEWPGGAPLVQVVSPGGAVFGDERFLNNIAS